MGPSLIESLKVLSYKEFITVMIEKKCEGMPAYPHS